METILIHLQRPTELLIAVLIKPHDNHNPYMLIKTQYGVDRLNELEQSAEYNHLLTAELPASLDDIYEWKDQYKDRFVKGLVYNKNQSKK